MNHPHNDDLHQLPGTTNIWANETGLKWWTEYQATKDPRDATRCLWADWQCPFAAKGEGFICQNKHRKQELANIATWNWRRERRLIAPVVQLKLFERVITHETVWVHADGRVVTEFPYPSPVLTSCKRMAVANVKWLETRQGWINQTWRILPLTKRKADRAWKDEMIERHGFKACVFDAF